MLQGFPHSRLRRLRANAAIRSLVAEHQLSISDLIYPVFVHDGKSPTEAIAEMPGIYRYSLAYLPKIAEQVVACGVRSVALFPVISASKKTIDGREAYNEAGLVPRAVQTLKREFPDLLVITDVALDPYTSHGQDGIVNADGWVLNDETIEVLPKQALCHAAAGADMVAPSDMMDGRIGRIRTELEQNHFSNTIIVSYTAKYASHFYRPFRGAVKSAQLLTGDKQSYQMSPANGDEALREAEQDIAEGADILVVKPAGTYLDVIASIKSAYQMPLFAYQVSGEYVMLKAAACYLSERECVLESLLAIKRAGANGIFTYYALAAADWLAGN